MKILCYGDSNTWGWVPGKLGLERFDAQHRWPAVMQQDLGDAYQVVESSLGGRTTMFDDPREDFPLRNGLQLLPITLEVHAPVDIVVLMLGTGDTKPLFDLPPEMIAGGMEQLIVACQNFKVINGTKPSKIVVVGPPVVDDTAELAGHVFTDATPKTRALLPLYQELAAKYDCLYLDSNDYVQVDAQEGIHITAESQQKLGHAMAKLIQSYAKSLN